MKKLLLLIITILTLEANAQTSVYHPFPESNAYWNVTRVWYFAAQCNAPDPEIFSYTFSGDTIIKSKTYHKVVIPHMQFIDTCSQHHYPTESYAGCINQDTALRKVYFISPNDTTRQVLYDFSLHVGDTYSLITPRSDACFSGQDSIISIDSILIGTNYRKRWNGWSGIASYIEGIGFDGGLLNPCAGTEFEGGGADGPYNSLTCFSQDGVTLYPNADSSCNIILSVQKIQQQQLSVSISPNPFHMSGELKINLEMLKEKNIYLQIFDATGRQLFQQAINSATTKILRDMLSDGFYFYRVTGIEGKIAMNTKPRRVFFILAGGYKLSAIY